LEGRIFPGITEKMDIKELRSNLHKQDSALFPFTVGLPSSTFPSGLQSHEGMTYLLTLYYTSRVPAQH
jgi:hypothetical protein